MTPVECPNCGSRPFHDRSAWRCMDCGATGKENQR